MGRWMLLFWAAFSSLSCLCWSFYFLCLELIVHIWIQSNQHLYLRPTSSGSSAGVLDSGWLLVECLCFYVLLLLALCGFWFFLTLCFNFRQNVILHHLILINTLELKNKHLTSRSIYQEFNIWNEYIESRWMAVCRRRAAEVWRFSPQASTSLVDHF